MISSNVSSICTNGHTFPSPSSPALIVTSFLFLHFNPRYVSVTHSNQLPTIDQATASAAGLNWACPRIYYLPFLSFSLTPQSHRQTNRHLQKWAVELPIAVRYQSHIRPLCNISSSQFSIFIYFLPYSVSLPLGQQLAINDKNIKFKSP